MQTQRFFEKLKNERKSDKGTEVFKKIAITSRRLPLCSQTDTYLSLSIITINSCVHQGLVLAPKLILLPINDVLSSTFRYNNRFADDYTFIKGTSKYQPTLVWFSFQGILKWNKHVYALFEESNGPHQYPWSFCIYTWKSTAFKCFSTNPQVLQLRCGNFYEIVYYLVAKKEKSTGWTHLTKTVNEFSKNGKTEVPLDNQFKIRKPKKTGSPTRLIWF